MSSSSKTIQGGDPFVILISKSYDEEEVLKLTNQLYAVSEILLGGRYAHTYFPEIKYLSTILYIALCSISDHSTIGQSYCGLTQYDTKDNKFLPISYKNIGKFTFLSGILTYLQDRQSHIIPHINSAIEALFSPEELPTGSTTATTTTTTTTFPSSSSSSSTSNKCNNTSTTTASNDNDQQSSNNGNQHNANNTSSNSNNSSNSNTSSHHSPPPPSLQNLCITICQDIIKRLWYGCGVDTTSNCISMYTIGKVFHDVAYYMSTPYTRYPDLVSRIANIHYLSSTMRIPRKGKYKILIWLLLWRIGCIGVYGLRIALQTTIYHLIQYYHTTRKYNRVESIQRSNVSADDIMISTDTKNEGEGEGEGDDTEKSSNSSNIDKDTSNQKMIMGEDNTAYTLSNEDIMNIIHDQFKYLDTRTSQRAESIPADEKEEEEEVSTSRQCTLCRGDIHTPTCTPCGHLYCWECMMSLIANDLRTHTMKTAYQRTQSRLSHQDKIIKCPACRYMFSSQQIRILYHFE